jgi:hypothetical protein
MEEQLRYIRETARKLPEHADEASDAAFSLDAKERIKQRVADQIR